MRPLFLLFLLPVALLHAQDIKKVTLKDPKDKRSVETYYVLKSNPSVKHGFYQKQFEDMVVLEGYYKNGKQDSLWTEYGRLGKIENRGNYKEGVKSGIWEYYGGKGVLEQKYDYDKKVVLYNRPPQTDYPGYKLLVPSAMSDSVTAPTYIGGILVLFKHILLTIQYPSKSRDNDVQGKVIVTFKIDSVGNTSNYRVTKGIADDLDAEAIRVAKSLPNNWVPAMLNGKPVDCDYNLPVMFKLM